MRRVPTRCRDEPQAPLPMRNSPRQTDRERRANRRTRTARVCLGARSPAPRQTTHRRRFVRVVPSRRTRRRPSPTMPTRRPFSRRRHGDHASSPLTRPPKQRSPLYRSNQFASVRQLGAGRWTRLQMLSSSRLRASDCSRVCFQNLGANSRTRSRGQSGKRIKTSRK